MSEGWNTYVVGNSNKDAHTLLTDILNMPGKVNPVIIWGASSTGKTKMLTDFATAVEASGKTVCKKTYEEVIGEILMDIHNDVAKAYRRKYRAYDYVIIDDLQFLNGKESTQEEYAQFIDELVSNRVQVILSLSMTVTNLPVIEEWRKCRWQAAVAELKLPETDTKKKALLAVDTRKGSNFPEEVVDYIVGRCKDFRSIEGAFNSVLARKRIFNEKVTVELAKEVLSEKQRE